MSVPLERARAQLLVDRDRGGPRSVARRFLAVQAQAFAQARWALAARSASATRNEVDALFAKYEGRPLGEKKRLVGEGVPYGRMGKPEDHVGCAIFLASPESDYVVAQTFNVDGGQWMSWV